MLSCERIIQLLNETLQPSLTNRSREELHQLRTCTGFLTELLLIVDNENLPMSVRQSALVYIKNMVMDHTEVSEFITGDDMDILKSSILDALIRCTKYRKIMLPTANEIVYLLAKKYYPQQWNRLLETIIEHITHAHDFSLIYGSVEALRAIFSVFGKSVMQEIALNNLCNRIVVPLLGLASKLFQNYNEQTGLVLISIFKVFNTAIYFYIPESIRVNLHSWMIFLKKILDLTLGDDQGLFVLKKICLRALFRIYQRHVNSKLQNNQSQFIEIFHKKYTKPLVETFLLQIMNSCEQKNKNLCLTKLSLSCLAYIYRENQESAQLIDIYREKLLYLLINIYKPDSLDRIYESIVEYRSVIMEERIHLKEMLFSLFSNESNPEGQDESANMILGLLFDCINKGDDGIKELCLYIFASMSTQIRYLENPIHDKMVQFMLMYVKPLLSSNHHPIIRCRACELVESYEYLQLPQQELLELAKAVYECLLFTDGLQTGLFLQVYAAEAYTSLLKHENVLKVSVFNVQNILQIYSKLLEVDIGIMRSIEKLLACFNQHIERYSVDLITMFIERFMKYSAKASVRENLGHIRNNIEYNNNTNQDNEEEEEDEESLGESEYDSNYESAAKACLACIRQLLQDYGMMLNEELCSMLWEVLTYIMNDCEQLYIEEGFNILNLILFHTNNIPTPYYIFLQVIMYGIEGIPNTLLEQLSASNNINDHQLARVVSNICVDVDADFIENVIGCLRNYLCKIPADVLRGQTGINYLQHYIQIVRNVHEDPNHQYHLTNRMLILMIYVTMLEWKIVTPEEIELIIGDVCRWQQMEQQMANHKRQQEPIQQQQKLSYEHTYLTYTPLYIQILYVGIWSYPELSLKLIDVNWLLTCTLQVAHKLTSDYEVGRVLVGICTLLDLHKLNDQQLTPQIIQMLPSMAKIIYEFRNDNKSEGNDMSEEAEEERFFGEDENTHMIGWRNNKEEPNEEEESDTDWELEFNKYYTSCLDQLDELKMLSNVLKGNASNYIQCLDVKQQEELSHYIMNVLPKMDQHH